jgi:pyruvate/2-oxoglutarate dehydrogenase complex dihydrolipoamide dehydrogenase (E3) component
MVAPQPVNAGARIARYRGGRSARAETFQGRQASNYMKKYDVIVIGSGAGLGLVNRSIMHELSTALVDSGPIGGTCLNLGCIPSKMLIVSADRIMEIRAAAKLGVDARIEKIDFPGIMARMRNTISRDRDAIRESLDQIHGLDFYKERARFVDDYVLVGYARYRDVAMGEAMMEEHGFAKAVVQKGTGTILGFHIIGPHASMLIQEVVNAVAGRQTAIPILRGMHIHPALSELIQTAIENLHEP